MKIYGLWYSQCGRTDAVGVTRFFVNHSLHLPSAVNTLAKAASMTQLNTELYLHIILADYNFALPGINRLLSAYKLEYLLYSHLYVKSDLVLSSVCAGDQVSRRGALTGGYYDTRKSRLDLQKGKTETQRALQLEEREYENHKAKLLNILSLHPSVTFRHHH